jgi:hypothetical protein
VVQLGDIPMEIYVVDDADLLVMSTEELGQLARDSGAWRLGENPTREQLIRNIRRLAL